MNKIAVIGVGNMGAPMSINLARSGYDVMAYDLDPEKLRAVSEFGVTPAINHEQAISGAEVVLTMLPTGIEVRDVVENHVLPTSDSGVLLIDSSTIDLSDAQFLHQQLSDQGIGMLDAPVSGGTIGAERAALTFMVGGEAELLKKNRAVLQSMGAHIVHCGAAGMGQAAKMCNNLMLGIQMASVSEGFNLAKKVGLDDEVLYQVATNSSGNCFALTTFCPIAGLVSTAPSSHNFNPGFSTDLMLKDMTLALNAAKRADLNLEVGPIAAGLYQLFSENGNGGKDFSAIYQKLAEDS